MTRGLAPHPGTSRARLLAAQLAPEQAKAQYEVLLSVFAFVGGVGWTDASGWGGPAGTECAWYGVDCDNSGAIRSLNLGNGATGNGLRGVWPGTILANLTSLVSLGLGSNMIEGDLSWFCVPTLQYLDLSATAILGNLSAIAGLGVLEHLALAYTAVTGYVAGRFRTFANLLTVL